MTKANPVRAAILTGILVVGLLPQAVWADWPVGSASIGADEHPKILAQFGGEIKSGDLSQYVNAIGHKIIRFTDHAGDKWTITVLDSPIVNAFALPGGYVYVTRGLLALANNEAELAGVLGHEIAHIELGHGEERARRENNVGLGVIIGTVLGGIFGGGEGAADAIELGAKIAEGYMSQHSRAQEFAADKLGVRLLAKAGYNPYAQADFLDQLAAKEALERRVSGQQYNPNRVDFFATHPATGKRVRKAIAAAKKSGIDPDEGVLNEPAYLRQIDGMVYGDTAREGFVRGQTFSHPEMRLTFTVPKGFILENSPAQVTATNQTGARFVMDGEGRWDGDMTGYIRQRWVPGIRQTVAVSNVRDVRRLQINGLDAATAMADIATFQGPRIAQLTAIRLGNSTIRLTALSLKEDGKSRNALNSAAQTFRALTDADIENLTPYHVYIQTVTRNDTIKNLSATMPLTGFRVAQFRAMNGYETDTDLTPGDLIKVVK